MENRIYTQTSSAAALNEGLRQFMIRVYNYMAAGLCLTALTAWFVANNESILRLFFNISPAGQLMGMSGLGWLMLLAPLIMVFAFYWVVARGTPTQVQMLFWSYAAIMGISFTPIFLVYTGASLARVFLITAGTFGAMSLYGYTTKRDLSAFGSFLFMGLIGIILASVVNIFLKSTGMDFAISILAVFIFTGLTAYDTQKIRNMYLDEDGSDTFTKKAIVGALSLYLDFINLFLYLLRFMGDRR